MVLGSQTDDLFGLNEPLVDIDCIASETLGAPTPARLFFRGCHRTDSWGRVVTCPVLLRRLWSRDAFWSHVRLQAHERAVWAASSYIRPPPPPCPVHVSTCSPSHLAKQFTVAPASSSATWLR